jgi:multidrug efflux pump subunit AcrB
LRRPYTFVVAALLLVLLMPFILVRTPTDIFPAINIPVISVIWQYTGLDARQFEQRITYVHERSLTVTVNNIEHIESTSYNGIAVVKVFLQPGASVDAAVAQITASAQTVLRQMPPGMTPPLIIQYNASSVPILQYSFSSPKMSEQELFDVTANQVRVGLANVRGAMIPWPYGGKTRVVSVDLSLPALKAKKLIAQDVVNAINAQNVILPSGTTKIGGTEYNVSVDSNPRLINDLNQLPIKVVNGATIYLSDVAQVHDGYTPQQNAVRKDGVRGALLTVMKAGTASTLDVVRNVKAALPQVMVSVTPDLQVNEFADQSLFVRAAISGVLR